MSYKLTILKYPDGLSLTEMSRSIQPGDVTLGRAASNDWALGDPQRYLSSQHCIVSCVGDQCLLTDTSTNGTFVNQSHEPLGRGNQIALVDGDTFDVGEYTFKVELAEASSLMDPFSESPFPSAQDNAPATADDFGSIDSFSDPFNDNRIHLEDSFGLAPDMAEADPLAALDKSGQQGVDPFASDNLMGGATQAVADPFALSATPKNDTQDDSYHDGSDPLAQSVSWPQASEPNKIPEDWDFMADDIAPVSSEPFTPVIPDAVQSHAEPTFIEPQKPSIPEPVPSQPVRTPRPGRAGGEVSRPERITRPQVVRDDPSPPAPQRPNAHIMTSMALKTDGLSEEKLTEINDVAGSLLREVTDGMMQLLRSRANIKNEFRMNVTTIQPIENNPLKFSVGIDEALENMFLRKNDAYKDPNQAFAESFEDIADHQIAIIAGIRFAYQHMIEQFNPEHLEKVFNKGKKPSMLSSRQNARNWTVFEDYYADLAADMERSFHHLFGDNFVQAYEDQLHRLKAERGVKK